MRLCRQKGNVIYVETDDNKMRLDLKIIISKEFIILPSCYENVDFLCDGHFWTLTHFMVISLYMLNEKSANTSSESQSLHPINLHLRFRKYFTYLSTVGNKEINQMKMAYV